MAMKPAGRMLITPELVTKMLKLPAGTTVLGAQWGLYLDCLEVTITGPGLPMTQEGELCKEVTAKYRTEKGEIVFDGYEVQADG